MTDTSSLKRPLTRFFVLTYLIFLGLFALTGAAIMLDGPQLAQYLMPIICSWSPTFAFVILFKKLFPHLTLREYVRQQFSTALNIPLVITIVVVQTLLWLAILFTYSTQNGIAVSALMVTSMPALAIGFLDQLVRGSMGEELGWRGYALHELQKKHSPLVASLVLGLVWGLWHTPLWLVSGYGGVELLQYGALFTVGIITLTVVITAFYNLNQNLLIPILIHQMFNFFASSTQIDSLVNLLYIDIVYLLFAVALIALNPKKSLYGNRYVGAALTNQAASK